MPRSRVAIPSEAPLVIINIGWMTDYRGTNNDPTLGGHGYLKTHDIGGESWNFLPTKKRCFGYVPRSASISLRRLGGMSRDEELHGITVVWVAKDPRDAVTKVVGWYQNATVYRDSEHVSVKRSKSKTIRYQIEVAATDTDTHLLKPDQRWLQVPTAKLKGNMGQCPVWYGNETFIRSVREHIRLRGVQPSPKLRIRSPRQPDPEARQRIETAAIKHAIAYYQSDAGGSRIVTSVEDDNCGWDLTVVRGNEVLKVEVKGLSGSNVCVELTPNEFSKMESEENRRDYVVYVVTQADTDMARSYVFYYDSKQSKKSNYVWSTHNGQCLKIERLTAARLSIL